MPFFSKPTYSTISPVRKKDIPKDLYTRCPKSGELIYTRELEKTLMVVPKSGYHFPLNAPQRVESLIDPGSWKEHDADLESKDILNFTDTKAYAERLETYKKKTGLKDAVISGRGTMEGLPVWLAVMDFRFGGASMGSVVGEKITRAIEKGLEERCAVIVVSASGGARMQEGIYSLMQMAKTSAALARLRAAGLPFISVLTHPTTGGVTICFAGPRVIKEGTNQELPEGFQRSEFLLERGLIDQIVPRPELRSRIVHFLKVFGAATAGRTRR
jgi:acetyl-CoA carboxylase carboxyl transferase subunit beta